MAIELQKSETQKNEILDNMIDVTEFQSEMKWLAWNVAEHVDKNQAKSFIKGLKGKKFLTNIDACFVCALLDNININSLSTKNKELANEIVNNWRWEWIEEMYNSWDKQKISGLFENIESIV